MKKQIAFLLIASTLASALSLASCKQKSTSENPFDVGAVTSAVSGQANNEHDTGWQPSNSTGQKNLYGKGAPSDASILRYGDMFISLSNFSSLWSYYSFEEPDNAKLLCFDPLCIHLGSECAANWKFYIGKGIEYPLGIYLDLYENADSPVIYRYYLQSDIYTVNNWDVGHRDPVYCIERYDLSKGKPEMVLDNVENTITQACNYGDYIYYVLDMGENEGQMLYRIHKSGGESEKLDRDENAISIQILDAIDDKFYYIINGRYIYRSELDLTESEMVLDMSEVKGEDGSSGVVAGSYSGYLYYFADAETVWVGTPDESPSGKKCNLYRIPMNDLTKTPEKVVEGMQFSSATYYFTEKTFYYSPCVYEYAEGGEVGINECDGKLYALDLESGESKLIVENSGMTIYPLYAWDDMVVFAGWAYDKSGIKYSGGNSNMLVAYTSGAPFEIWCKKYAQGKLSDEYIESIRAAQTAARKEYEANQNGN